MKAYLFAIARNQYLQWQGKNKRQVVLQEELSALAPGPGRIAEQRSDLQLTHQILLDLPENDRATFVLRVEHDLSYAEIARILALSEVVVRVKVHRIRKVLIQARLEKEAFQ